MSPLSQHTDMVIEANTPFKACECLFALREYMFKHCGYPFAGFEQRMHPIEKDFITCIRDFCS
ncbi:hypothetical protein HMPREF9446_02319 [Bacteroides fluxus YIT 12057]|uniref:Uncharacterized protein n=1 Tax=Bacteroides fluxus YIT 12057 TaxID=763034 RepID=F3PU96_9BACE|nr:hypothetical protein HMPREF9446_02319 [Bacteroides fluxus YIT 12057]